MEIEECCERAPKISSIKDKNRIRGYGIKCPKCGVGSHIVNPTFVMDVRVLKQIQESLIKHWNNMRIKNDKRTIKKSE